MLSNAGNESLNSLAGKGAVVLGIGHQKASRAMPGIGPMMKGQIDHMVQVENRVVESVMYCLLYNHI